RIRRARRRDGHSRLAVPARRARHPGVEHRLHRHRGRAARAQHRSRHRARCAALRRARERHLDARPRPVSLPAGARRELDADDPGARPALHRGGRPHSRTLERTEEGRTVPQTGGAGVNTFVATRDRLSLGPRHVAVLGMVLGVLAFCLTLPPLETHAVWVPALVGLVAAACGIWAVSRGVGRLGWGAIVIGVIGIGLGTLATRSSTTHLDQVVSWGALVASTLAWATPLCYAAVGGMFSERSGVVNGDLNLMIWLSFLLLVVASIVLFRTPIGLRLRAVGEHPRAAETVGISVYATRFAAVTLSGMLAALGGAYLSVGFVGSFNEGMTNGRGYIALAAVIF